MLVIAENAEEKKEIEKAEVKKETAFQQCQQVGIFIPCTNESLPDVMCWGEGSGNATYEEAVAEESHNAHLLVEYLCG